MDKYKKYQIIATICVALFIVNFGVCFLSNSKVIFEQYTRNQETDNIAENNEALQGFEARLNYNILVEKFGHFWNGRYEMPSYSISSENVNKIAAIKNYYRFSYIVCIISGIGIIISFIVLSKRRLYNFFDYGAALSLLFLAIKALRLMLSNSDVIAGIRDMIIEKNYSYFADGDLIGRLLYGNYARFMGLSYLILVFAMALISVGIRRLIIFLGRPHKF